MAVLRRLAAFIVAVAVLSPFNFIVSYQQNLAASSVRPQARYASEMARQAERLGRSAVAINVAGGVYISWRFLGSDSPDTSFNIYRDGAAAPINAAPIATKTNWTDPAGSIASVYVIEVLVGGVPTGEVTPPFSVWANQYFQIDLDPPLSNRTYTQSQLDSREGHNYWNFSQVPRVGDRIFYVPTNGSVAVLDDSGEYSLVMQWMPTNSRDAAARGWMQCDVYIDAYSIFGNPDMPRTDGSVGVAPGERMWRINLGPNINAGQHYAPFLVYDFAGTGKAVLVVRTSDGTTDASGKQVALELGATNQDHRATNGKDLSAPLYLTAFCGETGLELASTWYDPQSVDTWRTRPGYNENLGGFGASSFGDSNGNRSNRYNAAVAYLNGVTPSMVFQRGYYGRMVLAAYDLHFDGTNYSFEKKWVFDTQVRNAGLTGGGGNHPLNHVARGMGHHSMTVADVEGNGFDAIITGNACINNDGTLRWVLGYGHGDALHLSVFDPTLEGTVQNGRTLGRYQVFMVMEENRIAPSHAPDAGFRQQFGMMLIDAGSGAMIRDANNNRISRPDSEDTGRGLIGKFGFYNNGAWSQMSGGTRTGRIATDNQPVTMDRFGNNFRIYWDGDAWDEKWNDGEVSKAFYGANHAAANLAPGSGNSVMTGPFNTRNEGMSSINGTKRVPVIQADIFGDWREEFVVRSSEASFRAAGTGGANNTFIRIYTTIHETDYRLYTFMHCPVYRLAVAWQNSSYNQPPHVGFYMGELDGWRPSDPNVQPMANIWHPNYGGRTPTDPRPPIVAADMRFELPPFTTSEGLWKGNLLTSGGFEGRPAFHTYSGGTAGTEAGSPILTRETTVLRYGVDPEVGTFVEQRNGGTNASTGMQVRLLPANGVTATQNNMMFIDFDFMLNRAGGTFEFHIIGPGSDASYGRFRFEGSTLSFAQSGTSFNAIRNDDGSALPLPANTWHTMTIFMDTEARYTEYYINGVKTNVAWQGTFGGQNTRDAFAGIWFNVGGGNGNFMRIANLNIYEAVEEASIFIDVQPADDGEKLTVTFGQIEAALSTEATSSNDTEVSYQWYVNTVNSVAGATPIEGATGADLTLPVGLPPGSHFFFAVISAPGVREPAVTRIAEVEVLMGLPNVLMILTQPAATATAQLGHINTVLSVTAEAFPAEELTYQWFVSTVAENEGGTPIDGATAASYAIPTDLGLGVYYYYVVVTAPLAKSVTSGVSAVTVVNVAVTNITGVPNALPIGTYNFDRLAVVPANATNQAITWSVENAGTTGASFAENTGTLTTTAAGTAQVRATVAGGGAAGDYTQLFNIQIRPDPTNNVANVPAGALVSGLRSVNTVTGTNQENGGWQYRTGVTPLQNNNADTIYADRITTLPADGNSPFLPGQRAFMITELPDILAEAHWIRTSNDARTQAATQLVFTANENITIYLGIEMRNDPSLLFWLDDSWTLTDLILMNNEAHATATNVFTGQSLGAADRPIRSRFYIYTKDFAAGEVFRLGEINQGTGVGQAAIFITPTALAGEFIAVTGVTGVPENADIGQTVALPALASPSVATNREIVWSIVESGTTAAGAVLADGTLTASGLGAVTLQASVVNGAAVGVNFTQIFVINIIHTPVANITGIPQNAAVGGLNLAANVLPVNATFKEVVWSVADAGTTGAALDGSTLATASAGTVILLATILNGTAPGTDYTQEFEITVTNTLVLDGRTTTVTPPVANTILRNGHSNGVYTPEALTNVTFDARVRYTNANATDGGRWASIGIELSNGQYIVYNVRTMASAATWNTAASIDRIGFGIGNSSNFLLTGTGPAAAGMDNIGGARMPFLEANGLLQNVANDVSISVDISNNLITASLSVNGGESVVVTQPVTAGTNPVVASVRTQSNNANVRINLENWSLSTSAPDTDVIIPVTGITSIPEVVEIGEHALLGAVAPANATNSDIIWTVLDAGTTGAVINGSTLTVTDAGEVTIQALITDGIAADEPFTAVFVITVVEDLCVDCGTIGIASGAAVNATNSNRTNANPTNTAVSTSSALRDYSVITLNADIIFDVNVAGAGNNSRFGHIIFELSNGHSVVMGVRRGVSSHGTEANRWLIDHFFFGVGPTATGSDNLGARPTGGSPQNVFGGSRAAAAGGVLTQDAARAGNPLSVEMTVDLSGEYIAGTVVLDGGSPITFNFEGSNQMVSADGVTVTGVFIYSSHGNMSVQMTNWELTALGCDDTCKIAEPSRLPAPVNLHWDGLTARWDWHEGTTGFAFEFEVLRDNEFVFGNANLVMPNSDVRGAVGIPAIYTFRVRTVNPVNAELNSEWAEITLDRTNLPAAPAPENLRWCDVTPGLALWDGVDGFEFYFIKLDLWGSSLDSSVMIIEGTSHNFMQDITGNGAGNYFFVVSTGNSPTHLAGASVASPVFVYPPVIGGDITKDDLLTLINRASGIHAHLYTDATAAAIAEPFGGAIYVYWQADSTAAAVNAAYAALTAAMDGLVLKAVERVEDVSDEELFDMIIYALGVNAWEYGAEMAATLHYAVTIATHVFWVEHYTQDAVNAVYTLLAAVLDGLTSDRLCQESKNEFLAKIFELDTISGEGYTLGSYATMMETVSFAIHVYWFAEFTPEGSGAVTALLNAVEVGLVEVGEADKDALLDAINAANAVIANAEANGVLFTNASFAVLANALGAAVHIYWSATEQGQIDAAVVALNAAVAGLQIKTDGVTRDDLWDLVINAYQRDVSMHGADYASAFNYAVTLGVHVIWVAAFNDNAVSAAYDILNAAIIGLDGGVQCDESKDGFLGSVAEIMGIADIELYTAESVQAMYDALGFAVHMYWNVRLTPSASAAVDELLRAVIDGLVLA
jgi:rhamnogalacturonan endolyase